MTKPTKKKKRRPDQVAEAGDCVGLLASLETAPRLVIADPPYNQGMAYEAYEDNLGYEEYMAWTRGWLAAATDALHRHGSLFVFVPDEWVSEVDVLCKRKFKLHKRRHIVWTFTFGQAAQKNFSKSHCHILYYTKAKTRFTFNEDAVRVKSARQAVYADKRANSAGKLPDDTWMLLKSQLEPYLGPDRDTWLVSRICGTFRERKRHSPNQIPVALMERIVTACSDPGDLVVDPFCGTGSSGVACALHDRPWLGYDVSAVCVDRANAAIREARKK
jgi:DNA modification methylase